MSQFSRRIQEDAYYRLLGAAELVNVAFILQRKAFTPKEIQERLSVLAGRNGKVGICAIVGMPGFAVPSPDAPGPVGDIALEVLVLEHPELNAGSQGTGTNAEDVAYEIASQLHHYQPATLAQVFTARSDAIVPDGSVPGLVGLLVTVHTSGGKEKPAKVAMPTITRAGSALPDTVTITGAASGPSAGAAILYTTDGSNPSSGNPASLTYTVPFAVSVAGEIRAVASKSGMHQSNTARLIIT